MAEGGAWRSDVFDNGRDFHHGEKKQASPVQGVPAGMYNPTPSMSMRSGQDAAYMPIVSMALRGATILFSVVAFVIIATNKGNEEGYVGLTYHWKWWKAINNSSLVYLLSIDVIACFYSIVQLVLSVVSKCTGSPVLKAPKSPAATITFVCDQGLTYMLMAGCGAGASTSVFFKTGESGAWSCEDGFSVFCDKNAAAVAMSFFAFFAMALSTAMAYFRLYKIA